MIFADFIGDVLGWGCLAFIFILMAIGWVCESIAKAAGNALKSDTARDVAKEAFWLWWLSDDD